MNASAERVLHLPEKDKHGIVQTLCRQYVSPAEVRDDPGEATCKRCLEIRRDAEQRRFDAEEDHYGEPL
ncbi:hypothetical protein [Actinomadura verrucosospora]|uniref:Uncharacterized protein n=1 Tax=Actinomadura verrucosospora TaxID=46165 RepID=A0A7D3VXB8_ACTVE|nr:hypothetical protein [Actinomadura verrucosospora]QKG21112.1 hypothetical protein ACTIVE_2750 [Actinomadura verrucosospora]